MLKRFLEEERGVAMALAIGVMVIVGVMGAGLLVFVQNDLNTVVEVNQGQIALETADAGVKAARSHLAGVASPARYDGSGTDDDPWSEANGGVNLDFDGNPVRVTIEYLPPVTAPATPNSDQAPEVIPAGQTQLPNGREYFRVITEGRSGDARRKIEAILNTYDLDVPKAYFTPGSITVNGNQACISGVSLFALTGITVNAGGGCGGGTYIQGNDAAYGDWGNGLNPTPRRDAAGNPVIAAGMGSSGDITDGNVVARRDFDEDTCPRMVTNFASGASTCGAPEKITYPFNPDSNLVDIRELERIARENNTYYTGSGSSLSLTSWPSGSNKETVVYYKFTDGTPANNQLKWAVPGSCSDDPPRQGTLVVEGAAFTTQPSKARFKGVVIVREGEFVPGAGDDGTSSDSGNTCLEGFVNASGNITISGSVSPFSTGDVSDRPGFTGVNQWSWRELYQ